MFCALSDPTCSNIHGGVDVGVNGAGPLATVLSNTPPKVRS
jgi:hypothetical protein